MSINGVSGYSSASQQLDRSSFTKGQQMPSKDQMQSMLKQLKSSNPDLAAKMEKIGNRMEELQKGGTSMDDAMKTIEKEFGKPSDKDVKSLQSAGGPSGKFDVSGFLSSQSQNNSIMSLLSTDSSSHTSKSHK